MHVRIFPLLLGVLLVPLSLFAASPVHHPSSPIPLKNLRFSSERIEVAQRTLALQGAAFRILKQLRFAEDNFTNIAGRLEERLNVLEITGTPVGDMRTALVSAKIALRSAQEDIDAVQVLMQKEHILQTSADVTALKTHAASALSLLKQARTTFLGILEKIRSFPEAPLPHA